MIFLEIIGVYSAFIKISKSSPPPLGGGDQKMYKNILVVSNNYCIFAIGSGEIRTNIEAFAYSKDVLEVWPQIDVIKRIMQMSTYVDV